MTFSLSGVGKNEALQPGGWGAALGCTRPWIKSLLWLIQSELGWRTALHWAKQGLEDRSLYPRLLSQLLGYTHTFPNWEAEVFFPHKWPRGSVFIQVQTRKQILKPQKLLQNRIVQGRMIQCLGRWPWTWEIWIQFPAPPQTFCVTFDKSFSLAEHQFLICKMGLIALPYLAWVLWR